MFDNIVINTLVPALFTHAGYTGNAELREKAVEWLEQTASESNSIIQGFRNIGISSRSAFDSQSFMELKTRYCDQKRCLSCAVGAEIMKGEITSLHRSESGALSK
jgi:hypothetical protein